MNESPAAPRDSREKRADQGRTPGRRGPGRLEKFLACALPIAGALSQIRGVPLFRSDGAALSILSGEPAFTGALSTVLARIALKVPVGSHDFRMALPGAFAAGLVGLSVLALSHVLFKKQRGYSPLDPWLGMGAALAAAFSLPLLSEATVVGGGAVAAALTLMGLSSLLTRGLPRSPSRAVFAGVWLGALFAESPWCAALLMVSKVALDPLPVRDLRQNPSLLRNRTLLTTALVLSGAVASALCLLLLAGRGALPSMVPSSWTSTNLSHFWIQTPLAWALEVGVVWCLCALAGLLFGLQDKRPLWPFLIVMVADFLLPAQKLSGWVSADSVSASRLGLHLVAVSVIAPLGALGLRAAAESAQALRLFGAGPLSKMIAAVAVAGCLASAEDTLRTLSQTSVSGAHTLSEEAFDALPSDALVLTRSAALSTRLLAAQADGARPDVLVVPLPALTRPSSLRLWLAREPALEILLRDLSSAETPTERAITRLVDERPVFLEPDPAWDRRLLEHVSPELPLARFSPHALGRSDRAAALALIDTRRSRILGQTEAELHPDRATQELLKETVHALIRTMEEVKDTEAAKTLAKLEAKPEQDVSDPDAPALAAADP